MPKDWFDQNSPSSSSGQDWFDQNSPNAAQPQPAAPQKLPPVSYNNPATIGPPPSLMQTTGNEISRLFHSTVNSSFPYVHPLDSMTTAFDEGGEEIQRFAPPRVTSLLLGDAAAGSPLGTKEGLLNNPILPLIAGAEYPGMAQVAAKEVPEATGMISRAYQGAKNFIGNAVRDPITGQLGPKTALLAHAAGAFTGYEAGKKLTGSPYGGYLGAGAGAVAGPAIADAFMPASSNAAAFQMAKQQQEVAAAREEMYNDLAQSRMNRQKEQNALDISSLISQQQQAAAREQMYNDLARSRMLRQSQQDMLDNAAKRAEHARMRLERAAQEQQGSVMASDIQRAKDLEQSQLQAASENRMRDAQIEKDQIAQMEQKLQGSWDDRQGDLADRARLNDQWALSLSRRGNIPGLGSDLNPNIEISSPYDSPTSMYSRGDPYAPASNSQDLISRTQRLVISGQPPSPQDLKRAGDLTEAPLPILKKLATFGDTLARNELMRRSRIEELMRRPRIE